MLPAEHGTIGLRTMLLDICVRSQSARRGERTSLASSKPSTTFDAPTAGLMPPRLHGLHHYRFRLRALSVSGLPVEDACSCADAERKFVKHL